jgi:hypothetical protein
MEWLLVVICVTLLAIYAALRKCLSELKQVNQRAEITNGLLLSLMTRTGDIGEIISDVDQKLGTIENIANTFHDDLMRTPTPY